MEIGLADAAVMIAQLRARLDCSKLFKKPNVQSGTVRESSSPISFIDHPVGVTGQPVTESVKSPA